MLRCVCTIGVRPHARASGSDPMARQTKTERGSSMPTFHTPASTTSKILRSPRQAAEHVRVARLEAVAVAEQRDHVADGGARALHEVVGDAHRAVVAARCPSAA